ncbi:hypothetical protein AVEN_5868-1 [Araneus ventricosus]|uniref:Uncharacterized protein n=1 Tax=Araneus ventricosus TaxID=182803 RepID=A0A4Y2CF24_ARAVE|nr:hypothetical protein AVEN_5868-1 [Araneus ventricosus]
MNLQRQFRCIQQPFETADVCDGFVQASPARRYSTAIVARYKTFEGRLKASGQINCPEACYQEHIQLDDSIQIDSIIRDIPGCYAHVADLLIASTDQESHQSDLDLVSSKLSEHGIVSACAFFTGRPLLPSGSNYVDRDRTPPHVPVPDTITASVPKYHARSGIRTHAHIRGPG